MKHLLVLLLLLCSMNVSAQDVIVKKDGSTVVCRVVEVTATEITFKKWGDLNGSNYVMNRSDASAINYQNGRKVSLSEATNLYTPNNQNDGVQQYNDRALLAIDQMKNPSSKAKTKRIVAWTGGALFALVGIGAFANIGKKDDGPNSMTTGDYIGYGCTGIGLGVLWTVLFLRSANKDEKKAQMLQASSIYQYDFYVGNCSSLSAGIDMLNDRTIGNNTLGLGLRYNF